MKIKSLTFLLASFIVSLISIPASIAAGGGGGGGGGFNTPSRTAPSFDPVVTYQEAVKNLKAGNNKKAAKGFKKVLSVSRRDANIQYLYGVALYNQGKYKKAIKPLKKAIKAKPEHQIARGYLSSAYRQAGKEDDANTHRKMLLDDLTNCSDCELKDRIETAIKVADGAALQAAQSVQAFDGLANADSGDTQYLDAIEEINQGNYAAAIASLQKAAIVHGPHPDILTYLGFANRKLGNLDQAYYFYKTALSIQNNHRGAIEYLGEFYVETGRLDLAKAQLHKLNDVCDFGCEEAEELRSWITAASS